MAFVMSGIFTQYEGWQMNLIETCQKFYEKYSRYPNFIRIKGKTLDALFAEEERAFMYPFSEGHTICDSEGSWRSFPYCHLQVVQRTGHAAAGLFCGYFKHA